VWGIERGYQGLIAGQLVPLDLRAVGSIIHMGGTVLKTARCPEFKTREGLEMACETLKTHGIDGLIVIGGGGSFRGASELGELTSVPIIGVPATIDNDVAGTDETIGFDTAVNTALQAIDKIRDTATSHDRIFVVEVMGRDRGFLALEVGLTAGAGVILIPEHAFKLHDVYEKLHQYAESGKKTTIIVAAEGIGSVPEVVQHIDDHTPFEVRYTKLGHVQRGGSPTARSRLLAQLFGTSAVRLLQDGHTNTMVGLEGKRVVHTTLDDVCNTVKPIDQTMRTLVEELAV
jgi:6-phosphofructokinase 1